jgi:rhodanese-related sulfurtransferase
MASPDTINVAQLARIIGTRDAPALLDVRIDTDHASDPRMLPASVRRDYRTVSTWADEYAGKSVVVVCQRGQKLSQGVAAWLRHAGAQAESLEGGFDAWVEGGGLLVRPDHLPQRDAKGRTVWVTRARPKIDRIACPWLIRRFIDPSAVFLFVAPPRLPRSRSGFKQRGSTSRAFFGAIAANCAPSMS